MIDYSEFLKFDINIPSNARISSTGWVHIHCPKCKAMRTGPRKEERTLGVNPTTGHFKCINCNWAGNVNQRIANKTIKSLENVPPLTDMAAKMSQWIWETRKLSPGTLQKLKITSGNSNIRQIHNPDEKFIGKVQYKPCIAFPTYYKGEVIRVKYRDKYKNFALTPGAESCMYNMDAVINSEEMIIVEGEWDVAAWLESGYEFVASVPNGSTLSAEEKEHFKKTGCFIKENQLNLEYIDKHWSDFLNKKVIYLGTDTDPVGLKLMEELSRRLGRHKCKKIKYDWYLGKDGLPCKDANEVLFYNGKEALLKCKEQAEEYQIDGIIYIKDIMDEIMNEYNHGLVKGKSTGFLSLDNHFNWMLGDPIWLNGFPSNGKSSLAFNLLLNAAVLYGWKFGMYCPENYPVQRIARTMCDVLVGNTSDKDKPGRSSALEHKTAAEFLHEHFIFINDKIDGKAKRYTPKEILEKAEVLVAKKGIVGLFQDPWKSLRHDYGGLGRDGYLEEALAEQVNFATANGLINMIAHHPPTPKEEKSKFITAPTPFNMVGGQIWYASAYEQLCVHLSETDTMTEIHVQKVKDQKLIGLTTGNHPVLMKFQRKSGRFLEKRKDIWVSPLEGFIQNILNINSKNLEFEGF